MGYIIHTFLAFVNTFSINLLNNSAVKTILLTGDKHEVAKDIANELNIKEIEAI